jgi:hypothetical protein
MKTAGPLTPHFGLAIMNYSLCDIGFCRLRTGALRRGRGGMVR